MHYRAFSLAVLSAAALVLSGCEWGGVHENTWNDGYSWLNFTGTYALSELAALGSSGSTSSESETSESTSTVSTADFTSPGHKSGTTISGSISLKGSNPHITSFNVSLGGMGTVTGDPATGQITGENITGSFTTTQWTITYSGNSAGMPDSATASGTYTYEGVVPPSPPGGGGSGGTTISYLHITQRGNVINITDSAGNSYSGKTTGASTPTDGYVNTGRAHMSFEASGSGGRIVGSLSGVWSGSSDKGHGTLSGRTVHATMTMGGSNVDVVGTAPDMVISVGSSDTTTTTE